MHIQQIGDEGNCWSRITSCTETNSETDILQCCPVVRKEIADEKECFCSATDEVNAQDQADIDAFSQFLTLCKIPGTFDTLCPAGANNSTGRGRSRSRSTSISGSNKKVAYSVGLLLSSLLLINFLG